MRPLLLATVLILIISSCRETQKNQKAILPPDFDSEFSLDTSVKFQHVRNVAYGYSFSYPLSFVAVADTIGQVDSFLLYTQDRRTKIKFFVEGNIQRNNDEEDDSKV